MNSTIRLQGARDALSIVQATGEDYANEIAEMCATTVTDRQWFDFLNRVNLIPEEKGRSRSMAMSKREQLTGLYRKDPRCAPWNGTAYGVLQTVNTWESHYVTVKGGNRPERNYERIVSGSFVKSDVEMYKELQAVLAR